jgi:hypothetical protein
MSSGDRLQSLKICNKLRYEVDINGKAHIINSLPSGGSSFNRTVYLKFVDQVCGPADKIPGPQYIDRICVNYK